jgi:YD repeat-containing protein
MKTILAAFFFISSSALQAQYYYKDIIGTLETNRQMKTYLTNKVRTISATGFDQRGAKNSEFSEFQEIKENGTLLKISTFTNLNKTVTYKKFDSQGKLIRSTDSSENESITTYDYDIAGRISRIQNSTKDLSAEMTETEEHYWIYTSNGNPEKMWRILNNTDSLEIRFTSNENGDPVDERKFKNGKETSQYYYSLDEDKKVKYIQTGVIYYYYDDENRLSDIVRYNLKAGRLLPDIMFEYDDNNRVIQKITTTSNIALGYLIWRYIFDEKGLKTKEALFNKDKQLTGKIEYNYTYGQ